ncbi:hypothetical protein YC2023_077306 [Brassica napus]
MKKKKSYITCHCQIEDGTILATEPVFSSPTLVKPNKKKRGGEGEKTKTA